jgi:hypothetical protein
MIIHDEKIQTKKKFLFHTNIVCGTGKIYKNFVLVFFIDHYQEYLFVSIYSFFIFLVEKINFKITKR